MIPTLDRSRRLRALIAGALTTTLLLGVPAGVVAEDADVPPFASGIDKENYLRARAEYVSELRGHPHFLTYDPRARAIRETEAREAARSPQAVSHTWTQLGPAPIPNGQTQSPEQPVSGRVSAIAVDPTNDDIVYVGAAQGGVYRSTNGGTSWTQIFDGADSLAIGALAVAPSDPSILYVGTGESALSADSFLGVGLYRVDNATTTADLTGPINPPVTTAIAGTTAFTGRAISEILVHPTLPGTIFVATTSATGGNPSGGSIGFSVPPLALRGVYRSTDATSGAPTFTKLNVTAGGSIPPDTSGDLSITDIAMDPTNANNLVAWALGSTTAGNGGMYTSTDALAPAPVFAQPIVTNTASARGEIAGNRVGGITTFYVANGENTTGRLRKSTDGGITWSAALTGAQGFCNPQCFYDIAVDVHPTNANILNVGGSPALIHGRSTDGGATFTTNAQSAAGLHVDTHAIAIAKSDPTVVYIGTDGGIARSNDSGLTWTILNNTDFHATQFQSLALHPTDRQFLIGGTQDNGTQLLRSDGTWFRADFGDGGHALIDQNAVDTTNVTMYHTYFNQTTAKGFARVLNVANATDNGWTGFGCGFGGFIANGITCGAGDTTLFYAPMALGPGNPNTVYFGSDRLWRSTDQGVTMPTVSQVLVAGQPITTIAIAPTSDNARIAGTRNGRVFATTAGGVVMTDITNAAMPPPNPLDVNQRRAVSAAVFDPDDADTAYVAFGGFGVPAGQHVWKTTNLSGGAGTWVAAGSGIPDVPVNALVVDPDDSDVLYAGTDIGVFATYDGGGSWEPFNQGLPRIAVFALGIHHSSDKVLRAATHGRGIWEINADALFSDDFESGDSDAWDLISPP